MARVLITGRVNQNRVRSMLPDSIVKSLGQYLASLSTVTIFDDELIDDEEGDSSSIMSEVGKAMRFCDEITIKIGDASATLSDPAVLSQHWSALDLSVRTHRIFDSQPNLKTIGDLVQRTCNDLLELRNFGETCLREVREKLAARGFKLKGDHYSV